MRFFPTTLSTGKALSADPAMFLAHSMLSNPLCPQELVTMSPIQTVLGSDMNHTLPLFFYLNANGTVRVWQDVSVFVRVYTCVCVCQVMGAL